MQQVPLPWDTDPIGFLINRKFPALVTLASEQSRAGDQQREDAYQEAVQLSEAFFDELVAMKPDEVTVLVGAEKVRYIDEILAMVEVLDRMRFSDEPFSAADIAYWSTISYWTVDEAVALSLGRDPRVVSWERLQACPGWSLFVSTFAERRELVLRAIEAGQIFEKTTPPFFLAWAARSKFPMPEELFVAVVEAGHQIADWKTEYDHLAAFIHKRTQQADRAYALLAAEKADAVEALKELSVAYLAVLQKCESLEAAHVEPKGPSDRGDRLPTRERETLLKLVIGMAVKGYRYDPKAARSNIVPEIVQDLELAGVSVCDDTVRKFLREASQLLPVEA